MNCEFVVEDIGEALEENQGLDEVLELRRVCGTSDDTGRIRKPIFQHRDIQVFIR